MTYNQKISVVLTTYNGESFLNQQIDSILCQLTSKDELLIGDDGSTDGTKSILCKYANDKRIIVFYNKHMGLRNNLNFLISKSSGDIIFISDQDDIWEPNKIHVVCNDFEKKPSIDLVFHNSHVLKMDDLEYKKNLFDIYSVSTKFSKNSLFFHVWGCMFAFRKRAKSYLIPLHGDFDVWIMLCSSFFKVSFIESTPLMSYRRHQNNVSSFKKRRFFTVLISHTQNLLIFFAFIIRTSLRFKKSRTIQ